MRVMHSHLGEVSVGRTLEGVWEDEVWGDPCSGHHPFGFPNSSGEARDGQGGTAEVLEDVEERISISRKTGNLWASRRALNKEKSMEDGRWGLEPPRKPMALCANWSTKAS